MMNKFSILVVEDDIDINHMLCDLLEQSGYDVKPALSGTEALMYFDDNINLVLLDLMLPHLEGEVVLQEIRKHSDIPIINLTAKSDKVSIIHLLKSGADDYIVKPFNNDELLARIEVQLRRYSKYHQFPIDNSVLHHKDLSIDIETFSTSVSNIPINLTKREFLVLKLLMKSPKKVFTKSNIYESVWNNEFFGDDNTVSVHISNIRTKLAKINPNENYIQTVWGIGFKMSD